MLRSALAKDCFVLTCVLAIIIYRDPPSGSNSREKKFANNFLLLQQRELFQTQK